MYENCASLFSWYNKQEWIDLQEGTSTWHQMKTRYKAIIADHTYTIIGQESKQHMDLVTKIVNEQLAEIKHLSPQTDTEQASVLLAINAISDQLKTRICFKIGKTSSRFKTENHSFG